MMGRWKALTLLVALFAVSFGGAVIGSKISEAMTDSPELTGYFYGARYSGPDFFVLNAGLTAIHDNTNKQAFIDYILGKYSAPAGSADYVGAAYIIQTMRGPINGGSYAHGFPNASEIADWEAKINNPNIGLKWEMYSSQINSARFGPTSQRDVMWFNHADLPGSPSGNFYSLDFYDMTTGQDMYVLKEACANPLGNLPGLSLPDYGLTPAIDVSPTSTQPGTTITYNPSVSKTGTTASSNTNWQVTSFTLPPGATIPAGGTSPVGVSPEVYYRNGATKVASGTQVFASNAPTSLPTGTVTAPNLPGGSQICFVLSVQPWNQATTDWKHSTPECTVLSKRPTVQIRGGDLRVGAPFSGGNPLLSQVQTSTTVTTTGTFGSWDEYGIFAPSTVTGMASLSGLAGPNGNASSAQQDWSKLTFANVSTDSCPTRFGCYNNAASMGTIPDVEGRYFAPGDPTTALGASTDIGSLNQAAGVHVYNAGGDLTITGGTVQASRSYVIRAAGTVTITGDIQYTDDTLHSVSEIPQLVIIAKNITIDPSVTRVDAWLIAEGDTKNGTDGILDTCGVGAYDVKLTTVNCGVQLTVNGPVMAQRLWLRRTGGDGPNSAEVLNLRADAYLWAYTQAKSSGKAVTRYTKELPPLF